MFVDLAGEGDYTASTSAAHLLVASEKADIKNGQELVGHYRE